METIVALSVATDPARLNMPVQGWLNGVVHFVLGGQGMGIGLIFDSTL